VLGRGEEPAVSVTSGPDSGRPIRWRLLQTVACCISHQPSALVELDVRASGRRGLDSRGRSRYSPHEVLPRRHRSPRPSYSAASPKGGSESRPTRAVPYCFAVGCIGMRGLPSALSSRTGRESRSSWRLTGRCRVARGAFNVGLPLGQLLSSPSASSPRPPRTSPSFAPQRPTAGPRDRGRQESAGQACFRYQLSPAGVRTGHRRAVDRPVPVDGARPEEGAVRRVEVGRARRRTAARPCRSTSGPGSASSRRWRASPR
jgi:hypothetical protein